MCMPTTVCLYTNNPNKRKFEFECESAWEVLRKVFWQKLEGHREGRNAMILFQFKIYVNFKNKKSYNL